MIDRLNAWLLSAVAVLGLSSVIATPLVVSEQSHHTDQKICAVTQHQNAEVRDFLAGLLTNPTVSGQARLQVEKAALLHFPIEQC
jgi:hypothetical protein